MSLSPEDRRALQEAVHRLENVSLAMRIADKLGKPIEFTLRRLPAGGREMIQKAAHTAIEKCLDIAVKTLGKEAPPAHEAFHKLAAGVSGALGGFFGFAALAAELPVSTGVMLRSASPRSPASKAKTSTARRPVSRAWRSSRWAAPARKTTPPTLPTTPSVRASPGRSRKPPRTLANGGWRRPGRRRWFASSPRSRRGLG